MFFLDRRPNSPSTPEDHILTDKHYSWVPPKGSSEISFPGMKLLEIHLKARKTSPIMLL